MELSTETKRKLRDMGAAELLSALEAQDEGMCMGMTCAERVQMAVDEAHSAFVTSKVRNLTKRANLRYPEADVRSVDFSEERGLDRLLITELATCGFAERGQSVVLQGPTGTGKPTSPARSPRPPASGGCAPAIYAAPTWRSCGARRRERPGGERKATRKYAAFQVLVLDEWLLDRPGELFRGFLLELMEARYGTASTVFCTQFRQKDWHARLGGGVHADAIMDRIVPRRRMGSTWRDEHEEEAGGRVSNRARLTGTYRRRRRYRLAMPPVSDRNIRRYQKGPNTQCANAGANSCIVSSRAHNLPEHGTVPPPERDRNLAPLAVLLLIEHYVRKERPHLPVVHLGDHGVECEVDRLYRVHRVPQTPTARTATYRPWCCQ